jgi:hypothetical protein
MPVNIIYGLGGYCENCDDAHDHPLHNIISQEETPEPELSEQELSRQSAKSKLAALGLSEEEVQALLG